MHPGEYCLEIGARHDAGDTGTFQTTGPAPGQFDATVHGVQVVTAAPGRQLGEPQHAGERAPGTSPGS